MSLTSTHTFWARKRICHAEFSSSCVKKKPTTDFDQCPYQKRVSLKSNWKEVASGLKTHRGVEYKVIIKCVRPSSFSRTFLSKYVTCASFSHTRTPDRATDTPRLHMYTLHCLCVRLSCLSLSLSLLRKRYFIIFQFFARPKGNNTSWNNYFIRL